MRNIIIIQLLIAVLFVGCKTENEETVCQGFDLEQPTLNDELDYDVITAVLDAYCINAEFVHIDQETLSAYDVEFLSGWLDNEGVEYDSVLLSSYSDNNNSHYYLSASNFGINTVELLAPAEQDCIFSVDLEGWNNYYKKYPKSTGIFSFSRPGKRGSPSPAFRH